MSWAALVSSAEFGGELVDEGVEGIHAAVEAGEKRSFDVGGEAFAEDVGEGFGFGENEDLVVLFDVGVFGGGFDGVVEGADVVDKAGVFGLDAGEEAALGDVFEVGDLVAAVPPVTREVKTP